MDDKKLLSRILGEGRTTRREFMVGATAMGLSIAAASNMWTEARASEPKRGGHMKAGLNDSNTTDSLDPASFVATGMICISRAFRDSLVEVGQDNSAAPGLAESWESSADAKTWRFKLRKGVTFSNGKSLTTEDVINSINVHRGDDSKSGAKGVFAGISDVKADGNDVVVVTLAEANASFPFLMTDYHMNVVPTKDGKADVLSRDGTGCYLLKDFDPGVRANLEKNPNAWQGSDFGYVDSCEITTILDDTARQTALSTQNVDIINRPALKTVSLLKRLPHVNVIAVKSNLAFTHPMRMDVKPFDNNDFRQALKHALPRQEFVDKILFGYGSVGNDFPINASCPLFSDDIEQRAYDPDKVAFHFKKPGHDGSVLLRTSDVAFPGAVDAAQLYQQSAKAAGINIEVKREPGDGYWSEVWNKQPFCTSYWGGWPVQDQMYSTAYLSSADWNDTKFTREDFDKIIIGARAELDQAKRKAMYRDAAVMVRDEGGLILPMFNDFINATGDKVGGWVADPNNGMMNDKALIKCWVTA